MFRDCNFKFRTLFLIILAILGLVNASVYKIDPTTKYIRDEFGRFVINHGVNAVFKESPFIPLTDYFDAQTSLTDTDFQNLRNWGFNSIRLFVSWEAVNTQKDEYSMDHLTQVLGIVQKAALYNISVILDAHQDTVARRFCGEGFPDWTVKDIDMNFPLPLNVFLEFDETTGLPTIESCIKTPFYLYNGAYAAQRAWQRLYENENNIRDNFATFWSKVAEVFKNEPNVLGYEIINEPHNANYYEKMAYKNTTLHDVLHLDPFYDAINAKIREADNETLVFFEATVNQNNVGLTKVPGGSAYNDKSVFSFHVYCTLVTPEGEPRNPQFCAEWDIDEFDSHYNWAQKMGLASSLTEFGALSNSVQSAQETHFICNRSEANFISWYYWQFKYYHDITTAANPASTESFYFNNGTTQSTKVKSLARSYAHRICGTPVRTEFNPDSGNFTFTYAPGTCTANTEVYLSEDFYYSTGFIANFIGCDGCKLVSTDGRERFYYQIQINGNHDVNITLNVLPKPPSPSKEAYSAFTY